MFQKDLQYYKFSFYGFLKNLRLFEAFLLLFFLDNGLAYFQIGILYAIREVTVNFFEIPSGMVADAIGRRRTLVMAFVFYILSFVIFFFAGSFMAFVPAMFVYALGEAFRSGNNKAMIMDYLNRKGWSDQKVNYYGHTRSWSQMGSAISALAGGSIVFISGDYRYIFIFSVIPYLLDLALIISYPGYLDRSIKKLSIKVLLGQFKIVAKSFWEAIKSIVVLKAIANLSFYSGYYKAVKDYLQPVVKTFALTLPILVYMEDEKRASVFIAVSYFLLFMLTSVASRKSDLFARRFRNLAIPMNLTLLGGFAIGLLSGLFFWMEIYPVSILLFFGIYIVENLRKPLAVAYLSNTVEQRVLASTLSTDSQVKSLSAAILAPIIGIFADYLGVGVAIMIISLSMIILTPLYRLKGQQGVQ
jgi:MFS family permease